MRPKKTGLDYFPFDVDMFEDEKMVCVAGEFGIKGEIMAVKLLCAIYRNGYFIEWSDSVKWKLLRQLPGISSGLFDQILIRLLKWGFLDIGLFESAKVLTSVGIQRRYFEIARRRKLDTELPYLLIDVSETGVNVAETGVNVDNNPVNVDINPVNAAESARVPNAAGRAKKDGFGVNVAETPVNVAETRVNVCNNPQSKVNITTKNNVDVDARVEADDFDSVLADVFSPLRQKSLEAFCMTNHTDIGTLRRLADEVVAEWRIADQRHDSREDARKHLVNTLRIKIRIQNEKRPTSSQGRGAVPSGGIPIKGRITPAGQLKRRDKGGKGQVP